MLKELKQIAKQNGFTHKVVSKSDLEDGIGVVAGDNFVKNSVWYTEQQMAEELGLAPVQVKTVDLDAKIGIEGAKKMAVQWLTGQNATWYKIERCKTAFGGKAISICIHYGV